MKKLMQLYYINSFYPGHKYVFKCDSLTILLMSLTVSSAKFQANLTDRKGFSKLLYNYYFVRISSSLEVKDSE